jgi:hypothetical protein
MTRWRALPFAIGALAATALVPSSAVGGDLAYRGGGVSGTVQLRYTAAPGEHNAFMIASQSNGRTAFYALEMGSPFAWPAQCEQAPSGIQPAVNCPAAGVTDVLLDLGDGADSAMVGQNGGMSVPASVYGGAGDDSLSSWAWTTDPGDVLDGGAGDDRVGGGWAADVLIGGDGQDAIDATVPNRDADADRAAPDRVTCGSGIDTVTADAVDDVAADCEHVTLIAGPAGPMSRSDGRPVGVSIERGARFVNTPEVMLTILAPDPATHVIVSNDGGFAAAQRFPVDRGSNAYRWQLDDSGAERLPKIVYVRFVGSGVDPTATVSDDLILDQTAPIGVVARVVGRRTRGCPSPTAGSCVHVAVAARDATSGVTRMQFARDRRHPARAIRFRRRVLLTRAPRWVRVRDTARNLSRWRRVRSAGA